MTIPSLFGAVPLVAAVLLLAGCGSGTSEKAQSYVYTGQASISVLTKPITMGQFISRANKICLHGWGEIRESLRAYEDEQPLTMADEELFARTTRLYLLPGMDIEIFDEVRRLGSPRGSEALVEEALGRMQEAIEHAEKLHISSARRLAGLFRIFNALAQKDGLDGCAVTGSRLRRGRQR